jgi:endonuclease YncB( thermonuclease family)
MAAIFKHKKHILIFILFILFPIITLQAHETFKVIKVVDGDTLKVEYKAKEEYIRLIGIDTPKAESIKRH